MNFCTSCGSPAGGQRFCGNCGAALPGPSSESAPTQPAPGAAEAAQVQAWSPAAPSTPSATVTPDATAAPGATAAAGSTAAPGATAAAGTTAAAAAGTTADPTSPQPTDLGALVREHPGPAVRAGLVLLLVLVALVRPWEFTSLGYWGAAGESTSGAGNGWALVTLLLVVASAAVGLFRDKVDDLRLPVPTRLLQFLLVVPFAFVVLIMLVRMLNDESMPGPSLAIGVAAAVLAIQVGAPSADADAWRITAMVVLGVGVLLTLWGMAPLLDLSGTVLFIFLVTVVWMPLIALWFIMGLREHKPAEWAALVVFGGSTLLLMLFVDTPFTAALDVGLIAFVVGMLAATAPGVATLMRVSSDPAERWLQWVAGIMVLWMVAGLVTGLLGLLSAIAFSDFGGSVAPMLWIMVWGVGSAIAAGVARKQLVEDPAKGRKVAAAFAVVSMVLWVISMVAADVSLDDPAALLTGLAVPITVLLMLTVPRSVNQRYGSLLPASTTGPAWD